MDAKYLMSEENPQDDFLPMEREKREIIVPENPEQDLETARRNLLKLTTVADQAVDEMGELAFTAQSARGYEVLGQLIEKGLAANRELVDVLKRRRDLQSGEGPRTVNNTLVLTGSEALDLVKKKLRDG